MTMSHNIQELKKEFLEYIEIEKGRSLKTVANYDHYLTRFLDYSEVREPKNINESLLRDFRLWLNRQSGGRGRAMPKTLKKKTQNYYLIALRAFLKYLNKRGHHTVSPEYIELAKTGERQLDLISRAELERLLLAPDGHDVKNLRDRAILELLFSTGLRVSELCSLPRDLDLSASEITVRGKGEKVRVVFLSDTAKQALKDYLAKRTDMDDAIFARMGKEISSGQELRLTSRSIERIVKHYAVKAGISKKVTPHIIRHSFATDLLRNGADIRSVQILLGHANISTTQIYTHVTDSELRRVHQKFHNKGH